MTTHQGYYLSNAQLSLLNKTRQYGMTEDMLRRWELNPVEKVKKEMTGGMLSPMHEAPANFTAYHAKAVMILMNHAHMEADSAVKQLYQFSKHEAKSFVLLHQLGLTTNFIRDNRDKYPFSNKQFAEIITLLTSTEHISLDQALQKVNGLNSLVFPVLLDFYRYGLSCEDMRALTDTKETGQFVINACSEYCMHKDGHLGRINYANRQLFHYIHDLFHGALKKQATPRDAWVLTAGQIAAATNHFSAAPKVWRRHLDVQLDYLLDTFAKGVKPDLIPQFTQQHWHTYNSLRKTQHLSHAQALAKMSSYIPEAACTQVTTMSKEAQDTVVLKTTIASVEDNLPANESVSTAPTLR